MPPLVLVAIFWVGGLAIAHYWLAPFGVGPGTVLLLMLLPIAAALFWPQDRALRLSSACSLALLLGIVRCQLAVPNFTDPHFVAHYNDRGWMSIEGVVHGYPDERDTWTYLALRADHITMAGQRDPVEGVVLLRAPRFPEYRYGDALRVFGQLQTPPELEEFSYRDYLARRGVFSLMDHPKLQEISSRGGSFFWRSLYAVKDRARGTIARLIPDPQASLLQGILLGVRSGIPSQLYDEFNTTGTSHVLVISGANVVVVATLFSQLFRRLFGKRRAYWVVLVGTVLYVFLAGADMPVVRAGIMAGLSITAQFLGRRSTGYVSLCAAAVFLTALSPLAIWDASFQLTFAAALGVILFTPRLEAVAARLLAKRVAQEQIRLLLLYVSDLLIVMLAAQTLTIPVVALAFHRLSLVSPLANVLIAPVQPFIMSWGGAAAVVGLVPWLEPVARVIAWVPWLCITYTAAIVHWMAAWPLASVSVDRLTATWLLLGCLAALTVTWAASHHGKTLGRLRGQFVGGMLNRAPLGLLVAASILVWLAIFQLPDRRLHVVFLDVGEGDATLITTPRGQQILVDGGPSPTALTAGLGSHMPFWDRSLDLVVSTHSDADHLTGLVEVLERYRVAAWLDNGQPANDPISAKCLALLEAGRVARRVASAGDRFNLGEGVLLEVLHPPEESIRDPGSNSNRNSVVLRLVMNDTSFLLTGDIEATGEQVVLNSGQPVRADVLKVAHHGSAGSSTSEFLKAVEPSIAVISVGADNRNGHPAVELLDRLAQLDRVLILRTDQRGTVEFISNGQELQVHTAR